MLLIACSGIGYSQTSSADKPPGALNQSAGRVTPGPASEVPKCAQSTGLTQEEIAELLSAHNRVRSEVKIAPIVWDCKLATYAQEWAVKAVTAHRETDLGESIFVSSNAAEPIKTVVERWVREKDYWDNSKGTCQTGKVCNHYTQAVWKATLKIGCAANRSATGQWKTFVVCNYDPSGNWPGPAY